MAEASTAMNENSSCLASQCIDFTNQEDVIPASIQDRQKQSPSTLKRNSLRKKAFFVKIAEEKQAEPQLLKSPAKPSKKFKCNQCENIIEQLDGFSDLQKSPEKIDHGELWCYKCKEQQDNCQGWEHRLPNRPAIKAHMHNEHNITIFEYIDIDKNGGFKNYREPEKFYEYSALIHSVLTLAAYKM